MSVERHGGGLYQTANTHLTTEVMIWLELGGKGKQRYRVTSAGVYSLTKPYVSRVSPKKTSLPLTMNTSRARTGEAALSITAD